MAVTPQVENESEGMTKNTLIGLWSCVGVFALACVLFLVWFSHSSHQGKITAANEHISQAVASANDWLGGDSPLDGEAVEQELAEALKDQVATERGDGESVLSQVRQRREQLAEESRIEQGHREATAIWNDAKRQIDGKRVAEAIALLRKYVADPHATEKTDAQRLLAEAETAVSDRLALDALIAMTDEDFGRAKTAGEFRDGKVTHPALVAVRSETVQRNLEKAVERREEIRIAEEKRREVERLAAIERRRQEEERRKQEAARRAEEERLRAETERPKNGTEMLGEIIAFHERYIGQNFYIKGLYYPRELQRQREAKCFSIQFVATKGKTGAVTGLQPDRLSFVVSETMGSELLTLTKSRSENHTAVVHVRIGYLDEENQRYPVGYVKQFDLYRFDVDALKDYLFIEMYDDGRSKVHDNPFSK